MGHTWQYLCNSILCVNSNVRDLSGVFRGKSILPAYVLLLIADKVWEVKDQSTCQLKLPLQLLLLIPSLQLPMYTSAMEGKKPLGLVGARLQPQPGWAPSCSLLNSWEIFLHNCNFCTGTEGFLHARSPWSRSAAIPCTLCLVTLTMPSGIRVLQVAASRVSKLLSENESCSKVFVFFLLKYYLKEQGSAI